MAYIVPRTLLEQEFEQSPVFADSPLHACIVAPQYDLKRYTVTNEKDDTRVANYEGDEISVSYPDKAAGATVDLDYTRVFLEDAVAQYFPNGLLGSASDDVTAVTANSVRSSTLTFATANGKNRSSVFADRNVAVGDVVKLSGGGETLQTKVKGLIADIAAAAVGAAAQGSNNVATVVKSVNLDFTGLGSLTGITAAIDDDGYFGYPESGVVSDTYTVAVTTGGDYEDARFRVTSASGAVAPQDNLELAITGDNGTLTVTDDSDNDITITFTDIALAGTFLTSHEWEVEAVAAVTAVTPSSGGTYTGSSNISYILTVTRGGVAFNGSNADACARGTITASKPDFVQPVNIGTTAIPIGTFGVTLTFASQPTADNKFIAGDSYTVAATAATPSDVRTLVLSDVIPAAIANGSPTIELFVVKNTALTKTNSATSLANWTADADVVTLTGNVGITDNGLHVGGQLVNLPVINAKAFVHYRALLVNNSFSVGSESNSGAVASRLGPVHPDNPLADMVSTALLNSAGVAVKFLAVTSNDFAGYSQAMDIIRGVDDVHGVVVGTDDTTVQDLLVGHVNAMSTPEQAKWRTAWISVPIVATEVLEDGEGTLTGTGNRLLTIAGASFITDGVRPLDEVRTNYHLGASGEVVYDTFIVDSVETETTILVVSGPATAISSPQKVEVHSVFTKDEQINTVAQRAGGFNNRRVHTVFPDSYRFGSVEKPGYTMAAALAGLASGVVPHQGLTNAEVLGVTDLDISRFTGTQLDVLGAAGVFIVTQAVNGATPYVRHQLTTDGSGVNHRESSVTRNVDSISYGLKRVVDPFIGKYNVNSSTLNAVRNAIIGELEFRQRNTGTARAGNQLNGFEILLFKQSATFKDRFDVEIDIDAPVPLNYPTIKLLV